MTSFNNPNSPTGFTPIKQGRGGGVIRPNNYSDYSIAGAYGTNIFRGDLVVPTGTGTNLAIVASGDNLSIGPFKGCNFVDSSSQTQFKPYWPASQAVLTGSVVEASVFDDPDTLFDCQVSGTAGLVSTNIGNTCNINTSVAGNTTTGNSGEQADQGTLSSSSTTQQLQVQALRALSNNAYGQYARAAVSIYLHYRNAAVTAF